MKMANMDAVLDFMFTNPKHPNGVRKELYSKTYMGGERIFYAHMFIFFSKTRKYIKRQYNLSPLKAKIQRIS